MKEVGKAFYLISNENPLSPGRLQRVRQTTAACALLPTLLDCRKFVNADEIARGLSPSWPETVSIQAGRLMLRRLREQAPLAEHLL